MFIRISFCLVLVLLCVLTACGPIKPVSEEAPTISFDKIEPATVKDYINSQVPNAVEITFNFKDGDGDLGGDSCMVVKALRTPSPSDITGGISAYKLPELTPKSGAREITGKLKVRLENLAITTLDTIQVFPFEIYIRDQAGNKSNTITTSPVTITLN